jgi:hypothetical protein
VYDVKAPSVPGGLTAASPTETPPLASWNASTDDRSGVALYRVLRNGAVVGTSTQRSFTDASLATAGTYAYAVQVVDAAASRYAVTASRERSLKPARFMPPLSAFPNISTSSRRSGIAHHHVL